MRIRWNVIVAAALAASLVATVVLFRRFRAQHDEEGAFPTMVQQAEALLPGLSRTVPVVPFGLESRIGPRWTCRTILVTTCEGNAGGVSWELDASNVDIDQAIADSKGGREAEGRWGFVAEREVAGFRGFLSESIRGTKEPGGGYRFLGVRDVPGRGRLLLTVHGGSMNDPLETLAVILATRVGPKGLAEAWPALEVRAEHGRVGKAFSILADAKAEPHQLTEAARTLSGDASALGGEVRERAKSALATLGLSVPTLLEKRIDELTASESPARFQAALSLTQSLMLWDRDAATARLAAAWTRLASTLSAPLAHPADEVEWLAAARSISSAQRAAGDAKSFDRLEREYLRRDPAVFFETEAGVRLIDRLREEEAAPAVGRVLDGLLFPTKMPATAHWLALSRTAASYVGRKSGRRHVLAMLEDKRPYGEYEVRESDFLVRGSGTDHYSSVGEGTKLPATGTKGALRICDVYAFAFYRWEGAPQLQLWEPVEQRDGQIAKVRAWLAQRPLDKPLD